MRVVDVDATLVAVTGVESFDGALHFTVDPIVDDRSRWTEFRIVDVEPRVWWLTGIDGASIEVNSHGVIVRIPLVEGQIELIPGSY